MGKWQSKAQTLKLGGLCWYLCSTTCWLCVHQPVVSFWHSVLCFGKVHTRAQSYWVSGGGAVGTQWAIKVLQAFLLQKSVQILIVIIDHWYHHWGFIYFSVNNTRMNRTQVLPLGFSRVGRVLRCPWWFHTQVGEQCNRGARRSRVERKGDGI